MWFELFLKLHFLLSLKIRALPAGWIISNIIELSFLLLCCLVPYILNRLYSSLPFVLRLMSTLNDCFFEGILIRVGIRLWLRRELGWAAGKDNPRLEHFFWMLLYNRAFLPAFLLMTAKTHELKISMKYSGSLKAKLDQLFFKAYVHFFKKNKSEIKIISI